MCSKNINLSEKYYKDLEPQFDDLIFADLYKSSPEKYEKDRKDSIIPDDFSFENESSKFEELFNTLFKQSLSDNFFWEYCPFPVYVSTYENRKSEFLQKIIGSSEDDFLIEELRFIKGCCFSKDYAAEWYSYPITHPTAKLIFYFGGNPSNHEMYFQNQELQLTLEINQRKKYCFLIDRQKQLIENNLTPNFADTKQKKGTSKDVNFSIIPKDAKEIFKDDSYKFFCYLSDNYTRDDKYPKAKYSNILRFLEYEKLIVGTNEQYKSFIKNKFDVEMSKILPENKSKYEDKILPILSKLRKDFYSNT